MKYLDDLLEVGPEKPLGYLPFHTISALCKVDYRELEKYLRERGIEVMKFSRFFCKVSSGAFYAYDREALQKLLDKNQGTLKDFRWPTQADQFVKKVAKKYAPGRTPLYRLVAETFADRINMQIE